jgi:hypothetical integral membrane protein (TIGR02206 family)
MSESFRLFSGTHWLTLIAIAATTVALCAAGKHATKALRMHFERGLGLFNLFVWVLAHVYWLLPAQFDARTSLPLQLCHLAAMGVSLSLVFERRIWQTLVYYWGLGLSTQALLTPALEEGPAILWFWVFWEQHGILVAVACYHLYVRGYRPGWSDYRLACIATFGYFCVVFPIDLALGLNYGFVGPSQPGHPTIIDLLGPWPWRLASIFAVVACVMALITWPWQWRRRLE